MSAYRSFEPRNITNFTPAGSRIPQYFRKFLFPFDRRIYAINLQADGVSNGLHFAKYDKLILWNKKRRRGREWRIEFYARRIYRIRRFSYSVEILFVLGQDFSCRQHFMSGMDEVSHADRKPASNVDELKQNKLQGFHGSEHTPEFCAASSSHGLAVSTYLLSFAALFLYLCITQSPNSGQREISNRRLYEKAHSSVQRYRGFLLGVRVLPHANTDTTALQADMKALLELKAFLEPNNTQFTGNLYQTWNESDADPCNWLGITCEYVGGSKRVTGIDFTGASLEGELFDRFSSLTVLSNLSLANNFFRGQIRQDLNHCQNLKVLNLSGNFLEGNPNLTGLSQLEVLDLSSNRLSGNILSAIPSNCDSLISLNLSTNGFSGTIPETLGNCSRLKTIDLSENHLVGPVWSAFGSMQEVFLCCNNLTKNIPRKMFSPSCRLQILDLSANKLDGTIPTEINNCRELTILDISENSLSGRIPSQIGLLQSLRHLNLRANNLSRDIPAELRECHNLTFLDLSDNNFGGAIQPVFGELKGLEYLIVHGNSYQMNISVGILRLPRLLSLDMSNNNFSGPLPLELAGMHTLRYLALAFNKFDGRLPSELGQLSNLQLLDLSNNSFTGPIPSSFGRLSNLLWLMLANNSLTGPIPSEIGNCSSLLWLNLAFNQISGPLPESLSSIGNNVNATFRFNREHWNPLPTQSGVCITLKRWIPADYPPFKFVYTILSRKRCKQFWENLLQGRGLFPICPKDSNVSQLTISGYLQLTGNNLSGPLPQSIGRMGLISLALLGGNRFNGQLPEALGDIPLLSLNVSYNEFSGVLPESLGGIKCLQSMDLSNNNFSGPIPSSFVNLNDLTKFNVSYNPLLTGFVPSGGQFNTFEADSYIGDRLLCIPRLPDMRTNISDITGYCKPRSATRPSAGRAHPGRHSQSMRIIVLVVSVLSSASILICGLLTYSLLAKKIPTPYNSMEGEFVLVKSKENGGFSPATDSMHFFRGTQFTYIDILFATENFSDTHVIGNGGFGTVYRGRLKDGTTVAIKKLQQKGPQGEREFIAEMQTLGRHEFHENLVPLLGCCLFGSEKLLVYEFMSNGSLEDWLYDKNGGPKRLDWPTRYKIALGAARALKFLHHDCSPAVIHRDMKASNILLDEAFSSHVTDFGLARSLDVEESHVSTVVAGTLGYVPPEYCQSWRATTKGDVYSFGVVVLELATGRRPLSVSDNSDGNLVEWVRMQISHGRAAEALDPVLLAKSDDGISEELTSTPPSLSLSSSPSPWSVSAQELQAEQLITFLRLGCICTDEMPDRRPDMKQVLASLESLADI